MRRKRPFIDVGATSRNDTSRTPAFRCNKALLAARTHTVIAWAHARARTDGEASERDRHAAGRAQDQDATTGERHQEHLRGSAGGGA
eukprot:4039119-Pleurochrysis_carterae.AAC.1